MSGRGSVTACGSLAMANGRGSDGGSLSVEPETGPGCVVAMDIGACICSSLAWSIGGSMVKLFCPVVGGYATNVNFG
jgi:hypothetical protein